MQFSVSFQRITLKMQSLLWPSSGNTWSIFKPLGLYKTTRYPCSSSQWIWRISRGSATWTTTASWNTSRITVCWGGSCTAERATERIHAWRKRRRSSANTSCGALAARPRRRLQPTRCLKEPDYHYGSCLGWCTSGHTAWRWRRRRPCWGCPQRPWSNGSNTSGKILHIWPLLDL